MKVLLYRFVLLLVSVFLQISFFGILFPWFRAPLFLLGVVVAYALIWDFPKVLMMTMPLTALYDVLTGGTLTWFSCVAVGVVYITNFLSRRLLLERQGFGLWLYALVAYGAALFVQMWFSFWITWHGLDKTLASQLVPTRESLLFSLGIFIPVFLLTYKACFRFEEYVTAFNQRQFRSLN